MCNIIDLSALTNSRIMSNKVIKNVNYSQKSIASQNKIYRKKVKNLQFYYEIKKRIFVKIRAYDNKLSRQPQQNFSMKYLFKSSAKFELSSNCKKLLNFMENILIMFTINFFCILNFKFHEYF